MGCGCKKKKDTAEVATRTATVVVTEGQIKEVPQRPPQVVTPPTSQPKNDVESIVNKLNNILKP